MQNELTVNNAAKSSSDSDGRFTAQKPASKSSGVLIIAEIGINHNGVLAIAHTLIDEAIMAGADVAKFQLFKPELQGEHLRSVALSREQIKDCEIYCKQKGIKFACTAFDADSLDWLLKNTDMAFVKIGSGQWRNQALLDMADNSGLEVIQSVIAGTIFDQKPPLIERKFLHVVPKYPTPPEYADIHRLGAFDGLSDHSGDIFMSLGAVALGAKIIECHITLDKNQEGYDHKASLEPHQFKELVRGIRAIEKGLQ